MRVRVRVRVRVRFGVRVRVRVHPPSLGADKLERVRLGRRLLG